MMSRRSRDVHRLFTVVHCVLIPQNRDPVLRSVPPVLKEIDDQEEDDENHNLVQISRIVDELQIDQPSRAYDLGTDHGKYRVNRWGSQDNRCQINQAVGRVSYVAAIALTRFGIGRQPFHHNTDRECAEPQPGR